MKQTEGGEKQQHIHIPPSLQAVSDEVVIKPSEVALAADQVAECIYVVKSGFLKISVSDSFGDHSVQSIIGPEELFPLIQGIYSRKSRVDYVALSDVVLGRIPIDAFREALKTDAAFCYEILGMTMHQTISYKYRVDNLTYRYASERVAYRLLLLGVRFGESLPDGSLRLPPISQKELATTISLTREAVSKSLNKFEKLGAISLGRQGMIIKDSKILMAELKNKIDLPPSFYALETD